MISLLTITGSQQALTRPNRDPMSRKKLLPQRSYRSARTRYRTVRLRAGSDTGTTNYILIKPHIQPRDLPSHCHYPYSYTVPVDVRSVTLQMRSRTLPAGAHDPNGLFDESAHNSVTIPATSDFTFELNGRYKRRVSSRLYRAVTRFHLPNAAIRDRAVRSRHEGVRPRPSRTTSRDLSPAELKA